MLFRAAILLATLLIPVGAFAAAESDRPAAPKTKAAVRSPPMIFYLAKGENGACGTDCNEWIAAEGQIETGSAQQLRTFLTRLGKRKLPIFFHSPGGNVTASLAIGRLLRERDMTAGVSETVPVGCVGTTEQSCRTLKQSGYVLPATLRNVSACNSACVFALIGGKVRYVPPGARLGVHSSKVVIFRLGGGTVNASSKQIASLQRTRLAELNVDTRRYVQEMKVDVRLFELAAKIPHEDIHYLTREEIVGFGIDVRGSPEARWIAAEVTPHRPWAMKFFVESSGEGKVGIRSNMIQLECASQRHARLAYFRGLGSEDRGVEANGRACDGGTQDFAVRRLVVQGRRDRIGHLVRAVERAAAAGRHRSRECARPCRDQGNRLHARNLAPHQALNGGIVAGGEHTARTLQEHAGLSASQCRDQRQWSGPAERLGRGRHVA